MNRKLEIREKFIQESEKSQQIFKGVQNFSKEKSSKICTKKCPTPNLFDPLKSLTQECSKVCSVTGYDNHRKTSPYHS